MSSKKSFSLTARKKVWLGIIGILLISFLAGALNWPSDGNPGSSKFIKGMDFRLGLDLMGGTHLVYSADVSQIELEDIPSAIEGVRDVIERRVNAYGVGEPVVQTNNVAGDWRIIVELPGVKDVNQAIRMIGETPLLEFKEEDVSLEEREVPEDELKETEKYNEEAEKRAKEVLSKAMEEGTDFAALAREYSEDDASKENGGDLGWFKEGQMVEEFEKATQELGEGETTGELVKSAFGYHIIKKFGERDIEAEGEGEPVREMLASHILIKTKTALPFTQTLNWKNTELSGKYLKGARVEFEQNMGEPRVALEFDKEGGDLFAEITENNIGRMVAIFLDGQPISTPRVNEAIREGKAVITGRFSLDEAKLLVQRLNAGALPVPIGLISQQNVGPSLGRISLERSLLAGLVGLVLVALFMVAYYRLPGLLAVVALAVYGGIMLSLFKMVPVTLTLAGVAGFILSIGMAVDANVLIFERMKEEKKSGKPVELAIEEGFKRAWTSIRDGNMSTLITCFILYWFGTSVIKGFGLTLGIGVLVSMFSAIVITRTFLRLVSRWRIRKSDWLWG